MFCRASYFKNKILTRKAALQARLRKAAVHGEICPGVEASMTIEAAIAFPLFIFAAALMLLTFRMMETTGRMQEACEQICRDVCQYAYTSNRDAKELDPESSPKDQALFNGISAGIGAYAAHKAREAADDGFLGTIEFLDSECMIDGEMVTIVLNYTYDLPFSILGKNSLQQTVTSSRRAWIGKKRTKSGESGSEDDPLVYVGKNSTRYHLSASCHYLSNSLKTVPADQIEDIRNSGGGRYRPCSVCGGSGALSGEVYVMPSGSAYHTRNNCSAIIAYVKTVHLSEVEGLGVCSYCGK